MTHTLVIADHKKAIREERKAVWQRFQAGRKAIKTHKLLIKQIRTIDKLDALTCPKQKKVHTGPSKLSQKKLNFIV